MLPRPYRLTRERDFSQVYKHGELTATPHLLIRRRKTGHGQLRVGFVISTKVIKKATIRNWYKRRLRAWTLPQLAEPRGSWDVIITLRRAPQAGRAALGLLEEELRNYFATQSWR